MTEEKQNVTESCGCGCSGGQTSLKRILGMLGVALIGMIAGIVMTILTDVRPTASAPEGGDAGGPGGGAPKMEKRGGGGFRRSKNRMANMQVAGLVKSIESFKEKTGAYPQGNVLPNVDPWGNLYIFQCPGKDGRAFDIISYGEDGVEGGEEENADILSWDLKMPQRGPGMGGPRPEGKAAPQQPAPAK